MKKLLSRSLVAIVILLIAVFYTTPYHHHKTMGCVIMETSATDNASIHTSNQRSDCFDVCILDTKLTTIPNPTIFNFQYNIIANEICDLMSDYRYNLENNRLKLEYNKNVIFVKSASFELHSGLRAPPYYS